MSPPAQKTASPRPPRRWSRLLLGCLVAWAACDLGGTGDGGGCVRIHQGDYEFPVKRVVKASVAARVTQEGTDFLVERVKELVLLFFEADEDGKAVIPLDALGIGTLSTDLGPFAAEVRDVVISLDLASLDAQLVEGDGPATIRIEVVDAQVGIESAVVAGALDLLLIEPDLACGMGNGPDGYVALLSFSMLLTLATDDDGGLDLDVEVEQVDIHDIHITVVTDCGLTECQDGCTECELVCGALNGLADLASFMQELFQGLVDQLATFLGDQLGSLLLDVLVNDQPLAVEGELDLAPLTAALLPWTQTVIPLGVLARPAGDAFTVSGLGAGLGLEVVLDAGVDANFAHPCVGDPGSEPVFEAAPEPPWPETLADGGPYHLGLDVSEAVVNEALWAAWKAGILCVDVDSGDLAQLTGGDLVLVAGALELLLPGITDIAGADAPIRIRLRPRAGPFPLLRFGDPATGATAGLHLQDVAIDLDLQIGDQFLRVFGLEADLDLGLDIEALPGARLGLQLADLQVGTVALTHDELFTGARMDLIVPFVVDLALGVLGDLDIALDLDVAAAAGELLTGLPLVPAVRFVGAEGEWLRVLITLDEPEDVEPPEAMGAEVLAVEPGVVTLEFPPAPTGTEVQLRVGGGTWTGWRAVTDTREVTHPRLWLLGETSVEARFRAEDGARSETVHLADVAVAVPTPAPVAEAPEPAPQPAQAPGGCAAGGERSTAPMTLWVLLGLCLVAARRRRTLMLAWVLLAVGGCAEGNEASELPCVSHAECPDDFFCHPDGVCRVATTCDVDADCCPGALCFNGWCRPTVTCDADGPCEVPGTSCVDGTCEADPCGQDVDCPAPTRCHAGYCLADLPCGGACPGGTSCYAQTGHCLSTPDCFGSCAAGTVRVISADSEVDSLACEGLSLDCTCGTLAPLTAGLPGFEGRLVDTAAGLTHVSYEPVYGDLVLSRIAPDLGSREDVVLDGLPDDAETVGDPAGYRAGVADPGPDRGGNPAVLVDGSTAAAAVLDVVSRDRDLGRVRHTRVEAISGDVIASSLLPVEGDAGRYSCVTRDPATGRLLAWVFVARDPTGSASRLVRLEAQVDPPTATSDWSELIVEETPLPPEEVAPCDGECGLLDHCVRISSDDDSCVSALDSAGCETPCAAHHVCGVVEDGADPACWPRVYVDAPVDSLPFGAGLFVDCAATPSGVAVAWYDADRGALLAAVAPGGLDPPDLVAGTVDAWDGPDVGRHLRLAVGLDGRATIAYQNLTAGAVELARQLGDGSGWETWTVHDGAVVGGLHDLGGWLDLTHHPETGEPIVAYADATTGSVWLARQQGDGDCFARIMVLGGGAWAWPGVAVLADARLVYAALQLEVAGTPPTPAHTLSVVDVALPVGGCP